jgi:PPOX class probable F420-dependent enzyme
MSHSTLKSQQVIAGTSRAEQGDALIDDVSGGNEPVLQAPAHIPEAYRDLVDCPPVAVLTTVLPDGQPQTTVVWCNFDGTHVLVNTMRGFRKERNMRLNPRVTLLCYDPHEPLRSLEVRGTVVEMTETGAMQHLDTLSERYTGRSPYFGACVPVEFREKETPVLCKILPFRVVTLDARRKEVMQT